MDTLTQAVVRAERRFAGYTTFVREAWSSVLFGVAVSFAYVLYTGRGADPAAAFLLVLSLITAKIAEVVGRRYVTAVRDRALEAWLSEATGHAVAPAQARTLRRGWQTRVGGDLWRLAFAHGGQTPIIERINEHVGI